MRFVEYDASWRTAYNDFLRRLGAATDAPDVLPFAYYGPSPGIEVKRHLLVDGPAERPTVVAAVTVKLQDYVVGGTPHRIAVATYPVSLGQVEPRYAMVAMLLLRRLAEAYPLNLLLGMGPPETNVTAKLCSLLGWRVQPVPYLFFPRRIGPLAAKQLESLPVLAQLAGTAGRLQLLTPVEAWLGTRARGRPHRRLRTLSAPAFGSELDAWQPAYSRQVGFTLVRDSRQMNAMYPPSIVEFDRLAFYDGERFAGFAVLLVPAPEAATRRLGANVVTVVEFSLMDEDIDDGAAALAADLLARRLDAVICNTPHAPTVAALRAHGFWERTTNFYLATSPRLQSLLDAHKVGLADMVITRGDGDGPIGLGVDL
jgi:hypothetical protein